MEQYSALKTPNARALTSSAFRGPVLDDANDQLGAGTQCELLRLGRSPPFSEVLGLSADNTLGFRLSSALLSPL